MICFLIRGPRQIAKQKYLTPPDPGFGIPLTASTSKTTASGPDLSRQTRPQDLQPVPKAIVSETEYMGGNND
jgi:hypothetical protein